MRSTIIAVTLFLGGVLCAFAASAAEGNPVFCSSSRQLLDDVDSAEKGESAILELHKKCKPGDTIFFSEKNRSNYFVGRVCNFNRSIVVVDKTVICVISSPRNFR
jgi:hypothetical protein